MEQTAVQNYANDVDDGVKTKLKKFINNNFIAGSTGGTFGDDDSFLEHGMIDSTGVLELVSFIEEAFGIAVEDDELVPDNLDSLNRLVRYIERKKNYAA